MIVLAFIVSAIGGMAAFEVISPITIFNRNVVMVPVYGGVGMGVVFFAYFLFDLL